MYLANPHLFGILQIVKLWSLSYNRIFVARPEKLRKIFSFLMLSFNFIETVLKNFIDSNYNFIHNENSSCISVVDAQMALTPKIALKAKTIVTVSSVTVQSTVQAVWNHTPVCAMQDTPVSSANTC